MHAALFPRRYPLASSALPLNRQRKVANNHVKEENRLLNEKLGSREPQFTDAERRLLAVRATALGRKLLFQIETLVTPDTLLRWHRQLVAQKWNHVNGRSSGRPNIKDEIASLILRMTQENPRWGYTRILSALRNLGNKVTRGTIANVLQEHSIEPAPLRGKRTPWPTFLKAQWKILVASDFFTLELWRLHGLTTYYVLFFIELYARQVKLASITVKPDTAWILRVGRNMTDIADGILAEPRLLLIDRDTKYCSEFRVQLLDSGTKVIRLPPRSLIPNAYAARFVGSIKAECLNRLIFFSKASLRRAIREFSAHYHCEQSHQGLNKSLVAANEKSFEDSGPVRVGKRLGGMLNYYDREVA